MRILLLAMPDVVDFVNNTTKIPNLAIVSLAGSLPEHEVKVLDLVLWGSRLRQPLTEVLTTFRPQVVGLSAMTFQFDTLLRVARVVRLHDPAIKIVAGGYHATLLAQELAEGEPLPLDFMVRGEGEATFRELVAALENPTPNFRAILGLSYREEDTWNHNPPRPLLDLDTLPRPHRDARLATGFHFLGMPLDVAETSRGCPYNCKFCSITQMYGHTFRRFPISRVVADLEDARCRGAQVVFLADDNITYDIDHFRQVCQAIVAHGLNALTYIVQVSAVGIALHPELVADMDRANVRVVFVGFESMVPGALKDMKKPTSPEINQRAAALLRQHRMAVIAGCIIGYPDDTRETVRWQIRQILKLLPDSLYAMVLTPFPKTVVRRELLEAGLVVNPGDYRSYTSFEACIRTHHMSRRDLNHVKSQEALRGALNPKIIAHNNFLRLFGGKFLRLLMKNLVLNLHNLLAHRSLAKHLDI